MKALTLTQPWAQLVAIGAKKIETRSWSTNYRGWLAIHAGKSKPAYARHYTHNSESIVDAFAGTRMTFYNMPRGVIVAVAQLIACRPILGDPETAGEKDFGDFTPGRFAWYLENVIVVDPVIPCQGTLGLFDVPDRRLTDLAWPTTQALL